MTSDGHPSLAENDAGNGEGGGSDGGGGGGEFGGHGGGGGGAAGGGSQPRCRSIAAKRSAIPDTETPFMIASLAWRVASSQRNVNGATRVQTTGPSNPWPNTTEASSPAIRTVAAAAIDRPQSNSATPIA